MLVPSENEGQEPNLKLGGSGDCSWASAAAWVCTKLQELGTEGSFTAFWDRRREATGWGKLSFTQRVPLGQSFSGG